MSEKKFNLWDAAKAKDGWFRALITGYEHFRYPKTNTKGVRFVLQLETGQIITDAFCLAQNSLWALNKFCWDVLNMDEQQLMDFAFEDVVGREYAVYIEWENPNGWIQGRRSIFIHEEEERYEATKEAGHVSQDD